MDQLDLAISNVREIEKYLTYIEDRKVYYAEDLVTIEILNTIGKDLEQLRANLSECKTILEEQQWMTTND
jgi:hypothetical protein